jgi:LysM repeat protein
MKKLLFVFSFFCSAIANSQNLTVEGTAPNLYITHTVAPKEGIYSVGRLYNQNPKTIASFNNLVMEKGLTIGQSIKIPLNSQNLGAGETASGNGSLIPLTHVVAKSETLFKIGTDFNVTAAQIKKWNNLSTESIAPGTPLIVGHLKMTGAPAVAAVSTPNTPVAKAPAATPKQDVAVEKTIPVENKTQKDDLFEAVEPAAKSQTVAKTKAGGYGRQNETATTNVDKPVVKEEPVKPVVKEPATEEVTTQPVVVVDEPRESSKSQETKKAKKSDNRTVDYSNTGSLSSIEGVFAGVFTTESGRSLNTKNGEAATFKSTSGWQDKKYYVLMNNVAPGTILKIASADNKVVYAKVLGSMPEMKENNGLLLRISNAAASYLGIIDPKFPVQVSYYQ